MRPVFPCVHFRNTADPPLHRRPERRKESKTENMTVRVNTKQDNSAEMMVYKEMKTDKQTKQTNVKETLHPT